MIPRSAPHVLLPHTMQPAMLAPADRTLYARPTLRGLGELDLTEAIGLGTLAFVVGGALGFALGAAAVAAVR